MFLIYFFQQREVTLIEVGFSAVYQWYGQSIVCLAYLHDAVADASAFGVQKLDLTLCRWFTRGWALQELIAPSWMSFVDAEWRCFGQKLSPSLVRNAEDPPSLTKDIQRITGVPEDLLNGWSNRHSYNVATRMAWVSGRKTSRQEDRAYCLLGLFGVNMPLIYGEGDAASYRLQCEILL